LKKKLGKKEKPSSAEEALAREKKMKKMPSVRMSSHTHSRLVVKESLKESLKEAVG
jgi:hypothetical protein